MDEADEEALYRAVGERIRQAREGRPERLSQAALAERLRISRASVVNIEAGRQHAPLSLLWKFAQQLDIELVTLIPSKSELMAPPANVELPEYMREQLKAIANVDHATEGALSAFIAQAVTQLSGDAKQPVRRKRIKQP